MVLRLVLFDCDGTLVDSQRMIIMTMARAFERAGLPPPTDDATRAIIGLSLPEAVASALVPMRLPRMRFPWATRHLP